MHVLHERPLYFPLFPFVSPSPLPLPERPPLFSPVRSDDLGLSWF